MSNEILKMLCPNFPSDREVSATMSREVWYKVVGNILYVPPESYLRVAPTELDRYGEALLGFEKLNLALHAQGNSRWLIPWEMYKSESLALQVIEYLSSNATFITCDIECSHLGWDDNNMLLLGLKMRGEFKVHLIACFTPNVCKALSDMFAHKNIKFLWHNGKFDISRIHYILKVRARVDEDTMLLHYVGINERKGTHGLKDLAPLYLQAPQWDDKLDDYKKKLARQMRINVTDLRYDYIPLQVLCPYNAMDVYATEQLYDLFMQLRRPESERIYRMLMEASNVYAQVEENGFMLDEDYLNVLHIELANDAEDAVDEMERVANKYWDPVAYVRDTDAKSFPGAYFNHKSPKQLMWLLKKITGQDISSTNAEILEELYEIYPDQDFLKALLKVRTLDKQIDTYVAGIRNVKCNDGRVRASFKLHGTETGRLSCSDPNMQNIPRDAKIKNIFKAAPGKILVNLDYSQAELRVLAYLTQDPWLMDIFIKGQDLHNMVSISIFGEGFTKEQRMQAKAVNFGITYGRGAGSLSKEFSLTRSEGFNLIQKWYAPMPM